MTAETYTTRGSVRGSCGHRHRSIATAARCVRRDQAACQRQGGYSDRSVEPCEGTPPMTEDDLRFANAIEQGEID